MLSLVLNGVKHSHTKRVYSLCNSLANFYHKHTIKYLLPPDTAGILRSLRRFGSSCTDLFTVFQLHFPFSSNIFSLEIRISNSQVPWERATLGEQDDTNWSSVDEKSARHFNSKGGQLLLVHFLWNIIQYSINSFISRDVVGLFQIHN